MADSPDDELVALLELQLADNVDRNTNSKRLCPYEVEFAMTSLVTFWSSHAKIVAKYT